MFDKIIKLISDVLHKIFGVTTMISDDLDIEEDVKTELSEKAQKVVLYLLDYAIQNKAAPTIREIVHHTGMSMATLYGVIDDLIEGGFLARAECKHRNLRVTAKALGITFDTVIDLNSYMQKTSLDMPKTNVGNTEVR